MKKLLSLVFVTILIAGCTTPQNSNWDIDDSGELGYAPPELVGMSSERLKRIDRVVNEYLDNEWLPGAVAVIARKGQIVYHKSFGFRDLELNDSLEVDDIFRIASMTKAITTVAVMMLFEEGNFLLDDPVSQFIPEFKDPVVLKDIDLSTGDYAVEPAGKEITIRHLLTHTSGIGYGFLHPEMKHFYDKEGIPDGVLKTDGLLGERVKQLAKVPLLHKPGEKFTYGLNTDVLGYLVEVISSQTLENFFTERIFQPLGMNSTHFFLPDDKVDRLAPVYADDEEGLRKSDDERYNYPFEGAKNYYSGGGGLSSTAMDYMRFMQMLVNGGSYNGTQLLSRKTIDLMTTNQVADISPDFAFGLGFALVTDNNKHQILSSVGNYSWGGYFSTSFWLDPEEELVATFFTQRYPTMHGDIHRKFQVLTYQAIVD